MYVSLRLVSGQVTGDTGCMEASADLSSAYLQVQVPVHSKVLLELHYVSRSSISVLRHEPVHTGPIQVETA